MWGWHHRQTLALPATWFLTQETGGKKIQTAAWTVPQVAELLAGLLMQRLGYHRPSVVQCRMARRLRRNEEARLNHWHKA